MKQDFILTLARDNHVEGLIAAVRTFNIPVDFANHIGQTALHIAAVHGNVEAVNTLLHLAQSEGVSEFVNIVNDRGLTPLHFAAAAKQRSEETCQALLKGGAYPLVPDAMGRYPYELAGSDAVRKLLGGPDPKLFMAAASGDTDTLQALFEESSQMNTTIFDTNGNSLLHLAAGGNHHAAIQFLIDKGCFPDIQHLETGDSALHVAARNEAENACETMKLLVKLGCNPNLQNFNTNQYADGNWVAGEESVSAVDKTPLHVAVEAGIVSNIECLVTLPGIEINAEDAAKETALHYTVDMQDEEILEILLAHGADVRIGTKSHVSSLHAAASSGWSVGVQMMLEQPSAQELTHKADGDGWTALMLAVRGGKLKVVEALLHAGADPTVANKKGMTAFHLAAINGKEEVCKLLLNGTIVGANLRNAEGILPVDLAKSPRIAEIFSAVAA